ncbi:MAG: isoleucine--tRNA ligase [Phycisphaerales bacterium]
MSGSQPQPAAPPSPAAPTSGADEKNRYKATLNLPKSAFAMKANLVQNEAGSLKRWSAMNLYARVRSARAGGPRFVFHDGPPYANGSIHLGHLLNKVLKDFVVRTRSMLGFDCPYVPGWDCHGLPIEHKVVTELVEKGKYEKLKTLTEDQRRTAIRRECQADAEKFIKLQAAQMVRLLTLADYARPYKTMSPEYEGATLEVLADLLEQGLVYRALKPVHWSIANETALAEAELEYYDREDVSVYVDFEAEDAGAVYDAFGLQENAEVAEGADVAEEEAGVEADPDAEAEESSTKPRVREHGGRPSQSPCFMIWTTTPWTLPANLAIAVNPKFTYALVRVDGNVTVMAADAVERVTKAAKAEHVEVLATTTSDRLIGLRYRHPFVDGGTNRPPKVFSLVAADYVTLEDGTGLVHTAPGHGTEDYQTGLREGLPTYCPVLGNGTYDATVPEWLRGMDIWKANGLIVQHLRESGHLFYDHRFTHSYPHDWRGKTPVIFRSTEQWFVSVDRTTARDKRSVRQLAVAAADCAVKFVPEWGRNRMRGMLESRPDWCISRQRSWGLPIPAFFWRDDRGTEHALMTPAVVRAVAQGVREKGSDYWFSASAVDVLKEYDLASDTHPDAEAYRDANPSLALGALKFDALTKGPDILDVWFESGSSWNAVMRERSRSPEHPAGRDFPCDLYLEGSDQHRGWFQSSMLTSLGATGKPPYRALLTHGFMVDKDGKKMSKSIGNTIEVEDLLKEHGADVCRWWVASLSYDNDIKVDKSYFAVAGESYRKVRNTLRFMLSNLDDYGRDPETERRRDGVGGTTLDAWVLAEFDRVRAGVVAAYEAYDFQAAYKLIYDFCNDTLSATYLAAIKDRMYCDRPDSPRRRGTQATLWTMTDGLCRLLAPVLCHTADEAFRALHRCAPDDADRCVHIDTINTATGVIADEGWTEVFAARERAQAAMERAKSPPAAGGLGVDNPLDMGVTLPDPKGTLARFDPADLADLLGVSRVTLDRPAAEPRVIDLRAEPRCERSWRRDGTVKVRSDGGMLSDRDAEVVGVR